MPFQRFDIEYNVLINARRDEIWVAIKTIKVIVP